MHGSNEWSRGYPVGQSYPASWHSFQSPAHLRAVCAAMGVVWEVGPETPLTIAEVGCGTGYTAHMLAAGNPDWRVIGLDYNPAHIAEARSMAKAAGLENLEFVEADLAELDGDGLDRLPDFDLVTVHGVWSWVADPVREGVLRLLTRRLKPGGMALVSYNALPGAASGLGLARLVRSALLGAKNDEEGMAAASSAVQRLMAAAPAHLGPSTWRRLLTGEVAGARPGYIVHEFQTAHWRPSFFADVASAMASARCEYVGSASLDENFVGMSLTEEQAKIWAEAPDLAARELIFDLCVPRAFRRDLYVRGLRRTARDEAVLSLSLTAISRSTDEVVLKSQAGEARLPAAMIEAARTALFAGPRTVRELHALPGCGSATPAELLAVLVGSGCAMPLWRQPDSGSAWRPALAAARRFNRVAAERLAPNGIGSGQMGLASPALGGGLRVSPLELAVASLLTDAATDVGAAPAAASLAARLLPPGGTPPPEVLASLTAVIDTLLVERVPVWRELGIV